MANLLTFTVDMGSVPFSLLITLASRFLDGFSWWAILNFIKPIDTVFRIPNETVDQSIIIKKFKSFLLHETIYCPTIANVWRLNIKGSFTRISHHLVTRNLVSLRIFLLQYFQGSRDKDSVSTQPINPAIIARYIKIRPRGWRSHICMRVELYGCPAGKCIWNYNSPINFRAILLATLRHVVQITGRLKNK